MSKNMLAMTPNNARQALIKIMSADLVPMLDGSPGVGKSSIIHGIGEEFRLKVIDFRMAQCDPTDLLGFPNIDKEAGKAGYVPMDTFPLEGDPIPTGYRGWILFLDEFKLADPAVQKAAYKLVLDRMVGKHKLHPKCVIICAGNLDTDNAMVEEMSTALQSRLVHLELQISDKDWIDWATTHGIDHRITSFIKFKPDMLYTFKPDHTDKTYACPRTWEFASRLLENNDINDPLMIPILGGTLSEGVAREFNMFCRIYRDLPSIEEIIRAPASTKVPTEPSVLYAITGSIASHTTAQNAKDLVVYIHRLPAEFQVVCMREIVRRDSAMLSHAAITDWISKNAAELF